MSIIKLFVGSALGLASAAAMSQTVGSQAQWEQDPATDHLVLGGPIQTTASFRSDKPISIDTTLMLETQAGTTLHLGGPIGNVFGMRKGINKTGEGGLVLSGVNTYDGVTQLRQGTLSLQSNNALGTIGSSLHAYLGTQLVYQPGIVMPNNLQIVNAVHDPGQPPVGPYADSLQWWVNSGVSTQHGYMQLGTNRIVKQGQGVLRLAGNAFDPGSKLDVRHGGLLVDGSFLGAVHVFNDGWLQGQGRLGQAHIGTGGALVSSMESPGLVIERDLVFDPGSVFQVHVGTAGAGGPIHVQGVASLAGWVQAHTHDLAADLWPGSWEYPVLQADGGFAGTTFSGVDINVPFLQAGLRYDDNRVYLRFSPKAILNPDLGSESEPEVVWPFSGSWAASIVSALSEDSRFLRQSALRHVTQPRSGAFLWADTYYSHAERRANRSQPDDYRDVSGLVLGLQQAWGQHGQFNIYAGVQHSRLQSRYGVGDMPRYTALQASASADITSRHLGISAAWQGDNGLTLAVGAAQSWHSLHSRRAVVASGLSDQASARYGGRTSQVFGEVAIPVWNTPASHLTPYLQWAWVQTRAAAYTEKGGPAALQLTSSTHSVMYTAIGLKAGHTLESDLGTAKLYGNIAWRHAADEITPRNDFTFANGVNRDRYTARGWAIPRHTLMLQLGIEADIGRNSRLSVGYTGLHAAHYHDHGVQLALNVSF